jgi:ribosomal protein S18 acetylase RimI-like enzyme
VRKLLIEYAQSIDAPACFEDFGREMATLPGEYAPPGGILLGAIVAEKAAGCVALRRVDDQTCEMRRLYVNPGFRSMGLGHTLATSAIDAARAMGYRRMVLDTLPTMAAANALYISLGFRDIPAEGNPIPGARRMTLDL